MMRLLDTNSCIYVLTGIYPSLIARMAEQAAGSLFISSITYAELAYGTVPPDILAAFVAEIAILPFDEAAAQAYAALPFRRGSFDRLIAAHALSLDAALVTRNAADFADIAGLQIEDWTR